MNAATFLNSLEERARDQLAAEGQPVPEPRYDPAGPPFTSPSTGTSGTDDQPPPAVDFDQGHRTPPPTEDPVREHATTILDLLGVPHD